MDLDISYGYITSSCEYLGLLNLGVINVSIYCGTTNFKYIGGLCGENNSGTIENCYTTGAITISHVDSASLFGGLCGQNSNGIISHCYSTCSITSSRYSGGNLGGLCGRN
jgi:hypothetical protein